jgi:hypothetical protein
MTTVEKLTTQFAKLMPQHRAVVPPPPPLSPPTTDLDTLLKNDTGRKLFVQFLKEKRDSSDNLLTLYMICICLQNQGSGSSSSEAARIRDILEKTYNACFVKGELPYMNEKLKERLQDTLLKRVYNERVFTDVREYIKHILDDTLYPQFLNSTLYRVEFAKAVNGGKMSVAAHSSTSSLKAKASSGQRRENGSSSVDEKSRVKLEEASHEHQGIN